MNPTYRNSYATENEKEFLTGMGMWATHVGRPMPRLYLLKGYLQSMQKRTNWAGINRLEVERHVMMLIEREVLLNK